jgi:hypothetical protein
MAQGNENSKVIAGRKNKLGQGLEETRSYLDGRRDARAEFMNYVECRMQRDTKKISR